MVNHGMIHTLVLVMLSYNDVDNVGVYNCVNEYYIYIYT